MERQRIHSIDILRGIIMVVMALDHTRDFFHTNALIYDPLDLSKTHPALFLTRWITHFCMPAFVLLAGTAIRISREKSSPRELAMVLVRRGLWMLLLEFGVMRFALFFNFYFDVTILSVLWTFGLCFIILSAIVFLSDMLALVIGLTITLFHDVAGLFEFKPSGLFEGLWMMLMRAGLLNVSPQHALIVSYPVIPWLGVMLLGYSLGSLYGQSVDDGKRRHILFRLGVAITVTFVIVRLSNFYGDPSPWIVQKDGIFTVMSFFNTTKYPVSLLFTLMTIGPLLIVLAGFERRGPKFLAPILHFGRVPLFYFIVHFYLIHAFALLFFMQKTGKAFSEIDFHFAKSFGGITPEGGYSLPWVYVAWISVVALMYPACQWYDKYKSKHHYKWMTYL